MHAFEIKNWMSGKKIRRKDWLVGRCIYFNENPYFNRWMFDDRSDYIPTRDLVCLWSEDDWEEVVEKKFITMTASVLRYPDGRVEMTGYSPCKSMLVKYSGNEIPVVIGHHSIEVEVIK
jgi:hypothetical protein